MNERQDVGDIILAGERSECALLAPLVLRYNAMTPLKRHPIGGPEIVQLAGLLILIALIYKHFGPGVHAPVTLSVIFFFAIGLFLLARLSQLEGDFNYF